MALISNAQQSANGEAAPNPIANVDGKALAGRTNADLISKLGDQASAKVELSTKKNVSGQEGKAPAPTIASLLQAKAQQNAASGPMADAFVAGPDRPWGSRWVFGGTQPTLEDMNANKNPQQGKLEGPVSLESMKKLIALSEAARAQGGDVTQLKQASESTAADLSALQELVKQYGGEIEGVQTDGNEKSSKAGTSLVSGGDYLSAVHAAKSPAGEGMKSGMNSGHSGFGGQPDAQAGNIPLAQTQLAAKSKLATSGGRPELQVIPGGLSGAVPAGQLEGGLRSSQDELKPTPYETVFMAAPMHGGRNEQAGPIPPQTVMGHVVPGAMMKERLTSETLHNVAGGIQGMAPGGGGEMRIKLNPGNLGELMIRVSTNGKDVGLKVQASDHTAKKILEESIGSLRDSLAQQSLSLGRVDVVVAANSSQDAGGSSNGQPDSQSQLLQQHAWNQSQSNANSNEYRNGNGTWGGGDEPAYASGPSRGVANTAPQRAAYVAPRSSDSRLDVMA